MADIFDLTGLTINPEEATQISQAVFEYVLESGELADDHDIHTGIQWKTQIPFIGVLGLVGKKILKCKPDANGNVIPISEKMWDPILIGDRFEHCAVDANPMFKLFQKLKKINPDFYDRIDSDELGVVASRLIEAMKEMVQRIIWFGDKTAALNTGGGVFTVGTDLGFFNMLDGYWKQIFSIDIPTTSKYYVPIAQNATANYTTQSTLADDFAFTLFKNMWKKADPRLKQLVRQGTVKVKIHATSSIVENWENFKENKSLGFTLDKVEDGGLKNFFRNIEVKTRYDWDSIIDTYQNNGTKWNLPHRALMTTSGNIPIGTVSTEDLEKVESFYDKYHEVNVMDFRLKMDAKFLEDYLAVAAY